MGDKGRKALTAQVLHIFQNGTAQPEPSGYLPEQGLPKEAKRIFGELSRKGAGLSAKRQKIL